MAEALYRKYRPQVFDDVVGQEHIERTIKNAIAKDQVSHAYLFSGPRGTGKTTTARLLAKALLCLHGPTPEPDGTCPECVDIADGVHPDVYELDAASRTGVENVRDEIIGRVNFAPTRGSMKVYIIDEVHMLSTAAFNALLKTLEEPPGHVMFILCTTDPQKVPETIQSRCQRFDFHRISNEEIVSKLGEVCASEGVEFEGEALDLIAHRAEGGMRNALTSLEQLIAFGEGKVTVADAEDLLGSLDASDMAEIMRAVGTRDVAGCFNWTARYMETGADLAQFANDMAERVRNMYVLGLAGTDASLEVSDAERRQISEELTMFGTDRLARMISVLGDLQNQLRTSTNPRLAFEIALTRMVRPDSDLTLEALAERVEALEAGKSATAPVIVAPAPAPAPVAAAEPPKAVAPAPPAPELAAPAPVEPAAAPASVVAQALPEAPVSAPAAAPMPAATQASAETPAPVPAEPTTPEATSAPAVAPAPAAAEASSVPAAAPAGGIEALASNPAALQRVWRTVLGAVKKEKVSYGVLFVNVRVHMNDANDTVIIEMPADNKFAFQMSQKPDVQSLLTQAFRQTAGFDVPFRCIQGEGAAPAQAAPASAPTPAPTAASAAAPAAAAPVAAAPAPESAPAAVAPAAPESAPAAAAPAVPEPAPAPAPAVPAPEPVPVDAYDSLPPEPEVVSGATPMGDVNGAMSDTADAVEELGDMLSSALGEDIVFKEVDE